MMVMEFKTIVADPPWMYSAPGKFGNTLEHRPNRDKTFLSSVGVGSMARYGAMSVDEICSLEIPSAKDAHLYLWFTNAFAVEAHLVARSWGFKPNTILTWVKVKPDGSPSKKMGYYFRGATEHCLFAVKGKLKLKTKEALPTAYLWPRLPHSVKPDQFFDLVESASHADYLELFARKKRHGWYSWGNEIDSDIEIKTLQGSQAVTITEEWSG